MGVPVGWGSSWSVGIVAVGDRGDCSLLALGWGFCGAWGVGAR